MGTGTFSPIRRRLHPSQNTGGLIHARLHLSGAGEIRPAGQAKAGPAGPRGRGRPGHAGQHLHQRSAHQARLCSPGGARRHGGTRDGRRGGGDRPGRPYPPPRRPGGRQCGDLLRLLLFLPTRLGQQLHRSQRRLGPWLPHRRRAGGVCPGPLRRPGADQDPSRRDGPAGPVRGGHPGHRILGRSDLPDLTGGHGARPGRRPHRPVHSPVRPAGKPQAGHRL